MWRFCVLCLSLIATAHETPPDSEFFVNEIFEKYGNKNVLTFEGFEHLLENLGLGRLSFEQTHDVSIHKSANGSFLELHDEKQLHRHSHEGEEPKTRNTRHVSASTSPQEPATDTGCLSTNQILESYGLQPTHGLLISHAGFRLMCPSIVYELDQKHCWPDQGGQRHTKSASTRSRLQVWLEASASILTMSVAGLLCAGIVPLLNRTKGGELVQFLMAVAAGTLLGDALVHLLPQVIQQNLSDSNHLQPLYRSTFTLVSMIVMFIAEIGLRVFRDGRRKTIEKIEEGDAMLKSAPCSSGESEEHSHQHKTLTFAVIAGDILHNITDGLSIGAAFVSGQGMGLSCAIAVFCHELPHELGDYAALLKGGMGVRRALFFNLVSSMFSFIGMAAGIYLGEMMHAAPWINAFTAGSFIYIALVHLIPELKKSTRFGEVMCQTAGLILGVVLMFYIGLYEEELENYLTRS